MSALHQAAQQALSLIAAARLCEVNSMSSRQEMLRLMIEATDTLRAALADPVPHGCHVDLEPIMKPDGCVLDEGRPHACVYARRLLRDGKDKTACGYWRPIEVMR